MEEKFLEAISTKKQFTALFTDDQANTALFWNVAILDNNRPCIQKRPPGFLREVVLLCGYSNSNAPV